MVNNKYMYDINYYPFTIPSELTLFAVCFLYLKNPFHIENILLNYKRDYSNHFSNVIYVNLTKAKGLLKS